MVWIAVVVMSALLLTACKSDSNDVPTLKDTGNAPVETPKADAADPALDNEAKMMAFTECLREQGIKVLDPVVNALRHTPSGGSVTVSAASTNGEIEIAVADTGVGIAPEDISHIFERFWRADPARARSSAGGEERLAGGTGLGLSVAQSLVEAQGGRIWVESTVGDGTVFRFTLPLVQHNH
jgi:signal transduction histidine kinase